jgi:hypothetical protein
MKKSCHVGSNKLPKTSHQCPQTPYHVSYPRCLLFIELIVIALPSYISIYTNSPPGSPKPMPYFLSNYQLLGSGSMNTSDTQSSVIQRLLKYAQVQTLEIEPQESRAIFNDLQNVLCSNHTAHKDICYNAWNPDAENDIIRVRNMMNLAQRLTVNREWEGKGRLSD